MSPHPLAPVVALDIDGTEADYHGHFTWFAELWTGRRMPDPAEINPGLPLYKHLGMSRDNYNRCKLAFRQGGMKRSMPAYEGFAELVKHMRRTGAQVWFCTTRPYLRLDNVDPDTRHWFRRNGVHAYDGLIYGNSKYRHLVKIVGADRVLMVVDDLPEMCDQSLRLKLPTVLRDQPYNKHYSHPANWWRAFNNQDIKEMFDDYWRKYAEGH